MRKTEEVRKLPVLLMPEELAEVMDQLLDVMSREGQEVARFSKEKAAHKEEMEALEEERVNVLSVMRTKSQERDVRCNWVYDDDERTVSLVREDTGVVVLSRPMTAEDSQSELLLFEPKLVEREPAAKAETETPIVFSTEDALEIVGKKWMVDAASVLLLHGGKHKARVAWYMGHEAAALKKKAAQNPFSADDSADGPLHTEWAAGFAAFGALGEEA